jgi:hypothetical protein
MSPDRHTFRAGPRAERITLAVLALLYYAVPWRSMGPASAWVGAPAVFAFLILMPGVAMGRLVGLGPRDRLEAAGLRVILGYFAALAGCFLWTITGAALDVFRFGYPAIVIALVLAFPRRDDHRPTLDRHRTSANERREAIAVGAFLILVAAIVWVAGPPTHYQADTIDHAAYVAEVERTQDPFPRTAFYKDPGDDGADLRKSLMHALMGVFTRHLGIDPIALFAFLAGAQLVILCLVVYSATLTMFASRRVALVSVLMFALVFDGGIGSKIVRVMFYPNRFGIAPLMLFVAAATTHLRKPSRRTLVLCAVFGFTAAAVHVQYVVFTAFAAGVIVVWKTCSPCATWREHLTRSLAASLAAGGAILPYAAYRLATSFQTNELHAHVQGAMFVGGGLFTALPATVWGWLGWTGLAALAAIVPLWSRRRDVPGVGYAIASTLSVLFIVANPLVLPMVFDAVSYVAYRLGRAVPTYMLAAAALVWAFEGGIAGHRWWRRLAAALAIVALAIGAWNVVANRHVMLASSPAEKRVSLERWKDDIKEVTTGLPEGAVIASDPRRRRTPTSCAHSTSTRHPTTAARPSAWRRRATS